MNMIFDDLKKFGGLPIDWSRDGFDFLFDAEVNLKIVLDERYKNRHRKSEGYRVISCISSRGFGRFLEGIETISREVPNCPRIYQRSKEKGFDAVLAQASWELLRPDWSSELDQSAVLSSSPYVVGCRLLEDGFNILTEERFSQFIIHCVEALSSDDGLFRAHLSDGFIALDMGSFDFFYGFVFSSVIARKDPRDVHDLLLSSRSDDQYPPGFDVRKVSLSEITAIFRVAYEASLKT